MRSLKAVLPIALLLTAVAGVQAQTVKTTYNYPLGVSGVAVDYVSNRVYVLLPGYNADGTNAVQVLDGVSNKVLGTFTVPVANAIAVDLVHCTVFVGGSIPSTTNPSGVENVVASINPWTGKVSEVIPVTATGGSGIVSLAVDPIRHQVYVGNASDNVIDVIGFTGAHGVKAAIDLAGQTPAGLAVNYLTATVYAALNDNQVAVILEKNNSVTYATYGNQTSGIAVDLATNHEYVTDGVFDVPTVGALSYKGSTIASIPVGLFPQGVDVDFVSGLVFVANEADGTLSKISAQSNSVISTTTVDANSVAVNPREATVYAVGSTSVTVLSEN
jgi:DNA-binding beta-propeller fold protein YncE